MMSSEIVSAAGSSGAATGAPPAERLLLDIIDTVREPLVVLDSDFRVTHTNRAFYQTFRVDREHTIGEVLFALGDGQWDTAPLRELLHHRLAVESELYDVEVDHMFPAIGRKIMLLNARLVTHEPNQSRVILLAIEDVTERRLAERRLAAQRRELQRSNAALNEFAFVASHDLQEPLRKILSFGERLGTSAGPVLDGNARQYLERMLGAAARMRALISDLLAYSQVATSDEPFAAADLAAIAREVVADLETSIAEAGGRVEVGELPMIDADALQMRRLLQNLVGNALKYTPAGGAVTIGAAPRDGQVVFTVRDTGAGIAAEHLPHVFARFWHLRGASATRGTGLGLAIARGIVEAHGGRIWVESAVGEGSTFSFSVPTAAPSRPGPPVTLPDAAPLASESRGPLPRLGEARHTTIT